MSWPSTGLLSGPWGGVDEGIFLSIDIIPEQSYYMHATSLRNSIVRMRVLMALGFQNDPQACKMWHGQQ